MTTLLAALRLADSFFPSGMFTQSHGLEQFVTTGSSGAAQIEPLLHSYLLHIAAPGDTLAARWVARLAAATSPTVVETLDQIMAIDWRLDATKLAPEGRIASRRCGGRVLLLGAQVYGGALLETYAQRVQGKAAPGHQSVALAMLAAANGLSEDEAVLVDLHTIATSLVSAAVRLGALDHIAAQRMLHRAGPLLAAAAEQYRHSDWHEIGGYAPQFEQMQMLHRYAEMHMFVS